MPVANDSASRNTFAQLEDIYADATPFFTEVQQYLEPDTGMRQNLLNVSRQLYDFMKDFEVYTKQTSSLDSLLVDGFDNEQIWQQIELQNNSSLPKLRKSLKDLDVNAISLGCTQKVQKVRAAKKLNKKRAKKDASDKAEKDTESNDDGNDEDDEEDEDEEEDVGEEIVKAQTKKYKSSIVDDNFFQLRQMEDCLDELDQTMNNKSSNSKSLFDGDEDDGVDSDEEGKDCTFQDFFDPPNTSKSKNNNNDDNDGVEEEEEEGEEAGGEDDKDMFDDFILGENDGEDGEEEEKQEGQKEENEVDHMDEESEEDQTESTFERKQKQMQKKIARLEEENLAEKPWQLSGEALAKARPMNSLLEEFVSFEHTSTGAPTITEDTTLSLEDLIKRRIKDQAWDDVLRKEKPVVQPFEYKKAPELNQEKSKVSLAEVYEKEYLKEVEEKQEDEENPEHTEIAKLMDNLFVQLDTLSNFHFTPKPPQPEIKVITNAPSLQMEEVLPITMTDSSQLAPEEVKEKTKGGLVGDEEKEDGDRKRDRRQKKIKKKFAVKEREKKEKAGKVAKSDRKQAVDTLKKGVRNTIVNSKTSSTDNNPVKGSADFFNKLQDEVKRNISDKAAVKKKSSKVTKTAQTLKL